MEDKIFDTDLFKDFLAETPTVNLKPPAVTFGTIFKHEHKENFISDWLAYLLDPNNMGTTEPLGSLINIAHNDENCNIDLSEVNIQREYVFQKSKRRIDFLITTPTHIIGIENKIWSGLQDKQLADYSKQIKSIKEDIINKDKIKDITLVLLCPNSNKVKNQISHDFRLVTYDKLVEEFKKIRLNCFKNLRAALLMEDFISHVEEFFMNNTDNKFDFDFVKFQSQNRQKIANFNESVKTSKEQFNNKIKLEIENSGFGNDWTVITKGGSNYIMQIYKPSWNDGNIHYELLTDGVFPPNRIIVELHIEGKDLNRNDELKEMKKNVNLDKINVNMNYDDYDSFRDSIKTVIDVLKTFDGKYTMKVDTIMAK